MRNENDLYATPIWAILPLVRVLSQLPVPRNYWEPYASDGQITSVLERKALIRQGTQVKLGDIDPKPKKNLKFPLSYPVDAEDCTNKFYSLAENPEATPDLVVANPPYKDLDAIANSLRTIHDNLDGYFPGTTALLLRRSALEPTDSRGEIWQEMPPRAIIELPRFSMKRGKSGGWETDTVNLAWFIWGSNISPSTPHWSCVTRKTPYYTSNPSQEAKLWGYELKEGDCKTC